MIDWPAVIQYESDDELTYIASEKDWMRDARSYLYNHSANNFLIDSNGFIFNLDEVGGDAINPRYSGNNIALEDFIKLVRIHASTANRCCIEKISFRSVAEGIRLVASLSQPD